MAAGNVGVVVEFTGVDAVLDVVGQSQQAGGADRIQAKEISFATFLSLNLSAAIGFEGDGDRPEAGGCWLAV